MVRDCLPIASLMMVLFAYGTVVGVFYHIFFFGKSHSIALKNHMFCIYNLLLRKSHIVLPKRRAMI